MECLQLKCSFTCKSCQWAIDKYLPILTYTWKYLSGESLNIYQPQGILTLRHSCFKKPIKFATYQKWVQIQDKQGLANMNGGRRWQKRHNWDWLTVPGVTTSPKATCASLPVMAFLTSFTLALAVCSSNISEVNSVFGYDDRQRKVTCSHFVKNNYPHFLGYLCLASSLPDMVKRR